MMAASKPTFHMCVISLYHLCRYVFALMLTEHAQARPQFSISYLPLLKLCTDPLHRRDIDLTVIFKSGRILYYLSIPIPFIMPNRLTGSPLSKCGSYCAYYNRFKHRSHLSHARSLYVDGCSSNST